MNTEAQNAQNDTDDDLITYIGVKLVKARPAPAPKQMGKHPEGTPGMMVVYSDGYTSWSPMDAFDAYRQVTAMTFGLALEALKLGKKVARQGWNGKGMWLSLSGPDVREIPASAFWSDNNAEYAASQGGSAKVLPCITMKTATGEILMGWLASQSDMLATDWTIVD